jgi:hypothetical protein
MIDEKVSLVSSTEYEATYLQSVRRCVNIHLQAYAPAGKIYTAIGVLLSVGISPIFISLSDWSAVMLYYLRLLTL